MAKYYGGAAPIKWLETLDRRELLRWYAVYERQVIEEQITNEHLYPPNNEKKKKLPSPERMRELIDERIAEQMARR